MRIGSESFEAKRLTIASAMIALPGFDFFSMSNLGQLVLRDQSSMLSNSQNGEARAATAGVAPAKTPRMDAGGVFVRLMALITWKSVVVVFCAV
jgi:hypothetical protein